jgi:1-deoxy-D-xylulose-5-phosphate reductoisomerase
VHPESLVHALVGFADGALMAHLGAPDMRHAIGYALNWPRRDNLPVARLDLAAIGALSFRAPDPARYPALRLAYEVMALGGTAGAAFNAAKEAALDGFIAGEIGFLQMAAVVEDTLAEMSSRQGLGNGALSLDNVMQTDAEARALARVVMGQQRTVA